MKKLMVGAVAVAMGASVFADVYNVKFTAKTFTGAQKKGVEYMKSATTVVQGLYDSNDGKYYFWTGTGKNVEPIENVSFEKTDLSTDSDVNGKNASVNAEFLIGKDGELDCFFIAAGLGKYLKVDSDELVSVSGNFAGKIKDYAAYGTWSWNKNASATKKGIAKYINDVVCKNSEYTAEDFGKGTADTVKELTEWREVAPDAVETAKELEKTGAELNNLVNAIKELDDNETIINTISKYAQQQKNDAISLYGQAVLATNTIWNNDAKIGTTETAYENAQLDEANKLAAKNAAYDVWTNKTATFEYYESITNGSFFVDTSNEIKKVLAQISEKIGYTNTLWTEKGPALVAELGETYTNKLYAYNAACSTNIFQNQRKEYYTDIENYCNKNPDGDKLQLNKNYSYQGWTQCVRPQPLDPTDAQVQAAHKQWLEDLDDLIAEAETAEGIAETAMNTAKANYDEAKAAGGNVGWVKKAIADTEAEIAGLNAKVAELQKQYDEAKALKISVKDVEEAEKAADEAKTAYDKAVDEYGNATIQTGWAKTQADNAKADAAQGVGLAGWTSQDAYETARDACVEKYEGVEAIAVKNRDAAQSVLDTLEKDVD